MIQTLRKSGAVQGALLAVCSLLAAGLPATQVEFPLKSFFNGANYTKGVKIEAVHPVLTDATNLWVGSLINLIPAGDTNPVVELAPNDYTLTFADVRTPLRFHVPDSTQTVSVVSLITNGVSAYAAYPAGTDTNTVNALIAGNDVVMAAVTNWGIAPSFQTVVVHGGAGLTHNFPAVQMGTNLAIKLIATSTPGAENIGLTVGQDYARLSSNYFSASVPFTGDGGGLTNLTGAISGAGMSNGFYFPFGLNTNVIVAKGFGASFDSTNYYCAALSTNNWSVYTNVLNDRWVTFNVYSLKPNMWHVTRSAFPDTNSNTGFVSILHYDTTPVWADGFIYAFEQLGSGTLWPTGILIPQQTNVLTAEYIAATRALYAPSITTTQIDGPRIIRLSAGDGNGSGIVLPTTTINGGRIQSKIQFGGDITPAGSAQNGDYQQNVQPLAWIFVDPIHGIVNGIPQPELEIPTLGNFMAGYGGNLAGNSLMQLGTAAVFGGYIFVPCGSPGEPDATPVKQQTDYVSSPPFTMMGGYRTDVATNRAYAGFRAEMLNTNGDFEFKFYNPMTPPQSQSTNGNNQLNPWGNGTNFGLRRLDQLSITKTNIRAAGLLSTNITLRSSSTPIPWAVSGNDGMFWNSNKVLYWVTATKTNLISNGQ